MLLDLQILNGNMSLQFDSLNTIYTITLEDDADKLDITYEIPENANISIVGTDLKPGLNEVVLTVYNDFEQMSYYLYVEKEDTYLAIGNEDNLDKLEVVKTNSIYPYAVPLIGSTCFLLIILFFTLLFKKNKKL